MLLPSRCAALALGALASASADVRVTVDPATSWGVWDGWGVSLCWWAKVFGETPELVDVMYAPPSAGWVNYSTPEGLQSVPSLGLTVARYNVGGTRNETVNGTRVVLSPNLPWWKQMEGYWIDGASTDPTSPSWDWTADGAQRAALSRAVTLGVTRVELFSNSPMWWALVNRNPSGSDDGATDNLLPQHWRSHAQYMATVAAHMRGAGLPVTSVDPLNEPIATWWKASGTQEGCHFEHDTQASVVQFLREELDRVGLPRSIVRVSASDESLTDMALATWTAFNESARGAVDEVNVHGYEGVQGNRSGLYEAAVVDGGKALRLSEHGEGDATGSTLASVLLLDFQDLHMTSWVYWQTYDIVGWALIPADVPNAVVHAPSPKFYALAQYTRHVRPGMAILGTGEGSSSVAAYDASAARLVVVSTNLGAGPSTVNVDLSAFTSVSGPVTRWATELAEGGDKYAEHRDVTLQGKGFSSPVPANSVVTFSVEGVVV